MDAVMKASPDVLRQARADDPKARDRDLADKFGVTEADLCAAFTGFGVTRIAAAPSQLLADVPRLGEVMALTRVEACVHERVGTYSTYREGPHAGIVLGDDIDLRIFPQHWVHAFAVVKESADGTVRRSLQVFDAAGDSVHKIHLRAGSDVAVFDEIVAKLKLEDQSGSIETKPRPVLEPARGDAAKAGELNARWAELTDTHQFLGLVKELGMNRLGAYRLADAQWVRSVGPKAVDAALEAVRDQKIGIMIFVGNHGCIQIHSGPIENLKPMGPWQNVMDPMFNMHLRADMIKEVYAVTKPTDRGPAISVEAFDAEGGLILQMFPIPKEDKDSRPEWNAIVAGIPTAREVEVA